MRLKSNSIASKTFKQENILFGNQNLENNEKEVNGEEIELRHHLQDIE